VNIVACLLAEIAHLLSRRSCHATGSYKKCRDGKK
jgi:hypothetical protein